MVPLTRPKAAWPEQPRALELQAPMQSREGTRLPLTTIPIAPDLRQAQLVEIPRAGSGDLVLGFCFQMIPPQVHLRRPCYDFSFL